MTSKREISTANETASLAQVIKPVFFARLDFASGVQRFHTEIGPKTATHPVYGAEAYIGIGDFGGVSGQLKESVSTAPTSIVLTLTGLKAALINLSLTDDYFRRNAEVMLGLEDATGTLVANPEILFSGYMDKVDVVLDQGLAQMSMALESRGTLFLTGSERRFTDEDLQSEFPGDLAGIYFWQMMDLQLRWGDGNISWNPGFYSRRGTPPATRGG